ncbi:PREDICTED: pectinesterase 2-like [Nicotiana attenuata]|uniref:pectinesterase 2-like n=1 Tax=Nicotiana attenuata TaxID=49451 RepID=UPI000904B8BE|nr:PREDICTED: pectinesterase 2-like [Nicotiana attenuata]
MDKTIISGNKSYGGGIPTYYSATVGVNGQGFMAQDVTFRNIAGAKMQQAVALRATADLCTFYRSRMPLPGQYITITAQQKNGEKEATGFVLQNCTLQLATPDADNVTMYLGRPWGDLSSTVIMQSYIDLLINPKGWIEFEGETLVRPFYMEFNNTGSGANTTERVKWAHVTSDPKVASSFTVRNFIQGDKWIPSTVPHYLDLIRMQMTK